MTGQILSFAASIFLITFNILRIILQFKTEQMRLFIFVCILLFGVVDRVNAQFEKIIHQSFEIEEIVDLKFNIAGDYVIEPWAGNVILTETKVRLHNASPSIFKYYLEKERYNLTSASDHKTVTIESLDMERKPIRTKTGECYEFVKVRIFIPEDYIRLTDNHWRLEGAEDTPVATTKENDTEQ